MKEQTKGKNSFPLNLFFLPFVLIRCFGLRAFTPLIPLCPSPKTKKFVLKSNNKLRGKLNMKKDKKCTLKPRCALAPLRSARVGQHSICGSLVALRSPIFCSVSLRKTSHILER